MLQPQEIQTIDIVIMLSVAGLIIALAILYMKYTNMTKRCEHKNTETIADFPDAFKTEKCLECGRVIYIDL